MHRAGAGADARAIAASTLAIIELVATRLAPVIGLRGVEVLLGRAVHVASRTSPWISRPHEAGVGARETLRADLESHEVGAATDASCAVLEAFMDLLSTLIGGHLSDRLLIEVWLTEKEQSS